LVTHWMGSTNFSASPVAAYGLVMLMAGSGHFLLTRGLFSSPCQDSALANAAGRGGQGEVSVASFAFVTSPAFVEPLIPCALYVVVAIIWLVPDRRIENTLTAWKQKEANP